MARGNFFLSDWGIAITGYASPVPEKYHRPIAIFYFFPKQ
jgi:nicotinamide mononucleotide (NMN) deamidase PncC